MEVKETGRSLDFARTCSYLGTVADKTPAHQNPKHYKRRDIATFGTLDVSHGIHGLEHQEKQIMSHSRRKVKSREFVLMPSPNDHIKPEDANSVYHFRKYVQLFVRNHFGDKFYWFADIQPDSHLNSRVHAHIVVLNHNIATGKAMAGRYYGIRPLRKSVAITSKEYNARFRDYKLSAPTVTKAGRTPTPAESRIIAIAGACRQNPSITGRSKFKRYMAQNEVSAIYRRNRKHPERSGWKFKLKGRQRYYEKGARISKAKGGGFLASKILDNMLSNNRKLKAHQRAKVAQRKRAEIAQQKHAQAQRQPKITAWQRHERWVHSPEYQRRFHQWLRSLDNQPSKPAKSRPAARHVSPQSNTRFVRQRPKSSDNAVDFGAQWYLMPKSARAKMRADMAKQGILLDRDGQPRPIHQHKPEPEPKESTKPKLNQVPNMFTFNLDAPALRRKRKHVAKKRQELLFRRRSQRITQIKSAVKKSSRIVDKTKWSLKKSVRSVVGSVQSVIESIQSAAGRIEEIIKQRIPGGGGAGGNGAGPDESEPESDEPSDDDPFDEGL